MSPHLFPLSLTTLFIDNKCACVEMQFNAELLPFLKDIVTLLVTFAIHTEKSSLMQGIYCIYFNLAEVMVNCRTVDPFNGLFCLNLSASRSSVFNCGPFHTAICPTCKWWSLRATLHSALFSQPYINPRRLHSAEPCGVRSRFSYPRCTFLSHTPLEEASV